MRILLSIFGLFFCASAVVFAANQVKTTETYIVDSDGAVTNTQVNQQFSFYIGDNLAGVTNPVQSSSIAVSGVYTGNGNIGVMLDGGGTQSFTMANVSTTPTPFEFFYDPSATIAPLSAGTYTYTLAVSVPSTMTVYGLGAKAVISHRYKPPSCGGGYAPSGTVESSTFDTGITDGAAYNWIMWQGATLPSNTLVRLQLATSNNASGPWTYRGPDCATGTYYEPTANTPVEIGCATDAAHKNKRYFRYKTVLCSNASSGCATSGTETPQVDDIIVNWAP